MVDTDDLPGDWSVTCQSDDAGMEVGRFQLDRDGGGLFVVWVLERARDGEPFEAQLTTISDRDNRVRHDYPVGTFAAEATAIAEAEAFVECLDIRLADGSISGDNPSVAGIQAVLDEYHRVGVGSRLLRVLGQIGM